MKPGIGLNVSCAVGDCHNLGSCGSMIFSSTCIELPLSLLLASHGGVVHVKFWCGFGACWFGACWF